MPKRLAFRGGAHRRRHGERRSVNYPISFAIANAAAAASPPTTAVCQALRKGRLPVKVPFKYPKTSNASDPITQLEREPAKELGSVLIGPLPM
jgi:hypothetical protein